ncbi:MAG: NUDIX domain-containing protein, partial [Phycisphaerales bacterium]|nr:NUDIX domain-containing protein [Phycisphaerales bacterium]
MPEHSAGILLYRRRDGDLEVLLVHPGGPFFKAKDAGAWTIPKGCINPGEDPLAAARREFHEETGTPLSADAATHQLTPVKLKSGKTVHAWAVEGDLDPAMLSSNTFKAEWPPRSGKWQSFPEVDRAEWFSPHAAREKANPARPQERRQQPVHPRTPSQLQMDEELTHQLHRTCHTLKV